MLVNLTPEQKQEIIREVLLILAEKFNESSFWAEMAKYLELRAKSF